MADVQPTNSCTSILKQLRNSTRLMPIYNFLHELPLSINRKVYKQINLYTILIQEKSNIFVDQMPTCLVFKKSTFYAGINIFNSLRRSMTVRQV